MKGAARVLGREVVRVKATARESVTNAQQVDDKPKSVYELMTRRMLEELREDVSEVKGRVNTLLWLVIGAILLELLAKVVK